MLAAREYDLQVRVGRGCGARGGNLDAGNERGKQARASISEWANLGCVGDWLARRLGQTFLGVVAVVQLMRSSPLSAKGGDGPLSDCVALGQGNVTDAMRNELVAITCHTTPAQIQAIPGPALLFRTPMGDRGRKGQRWRGILVCASVLDWYMRVVMLTSYHRWQYVIAELYGCR